MEIEKKYLAKYLHLIAIEQLENEYVQKGYEVNREKRIGNFIADLVVKKGDEQIVIEVKTGKLTDNLRTKLSGIADYIKEAGGYKFLIVAATPPKEKRIAIDNLEIILADQFHFELPSELDMISTHTRPEEIIDITINEVKILGKSIFTKGIGIIKVELQFGSDGDQLRDDGFKYHDNFPFEFDITLENKNNELQITNVRKLEVDTSSFYK